MAAKKRRKAKRSALATKMSRVARKARSMRKARHKAPKKKGHIPLKVLKARHARLGRLIASRER